MTENVISKIWLLSAYRSDSHAAWADWLVTNLDLVTWHRRELPGRHFRWRIRGNPLSWLDQLPEGMPDLILATSMVDLATIKGLNPRLTTVPAFYYFHENQFAYPTSNRQVNSVEPQIVQLYGALAAQKLLFNSRFNRDSFLDGVDQLLNKMPDAVPTGIRERLIPKCAICPVPIEPVISTMKKDEQLIVWNHRWEYDKNPALFVEAMLDLADRGVMFRLALLGPRPSSVPVPLQKLRQRLRDRIIIDEKATRAEYLQVLSKSAIVVSTSLHEFQGLGLLEAASADARPLVPDALCYPEQYANPYRYPAGDRDALVGRLIEWLTGSLPPPVDVSAWYDSSLIQTWRSQLRLRNKSDETCHSQ